MSFLTNNDFTHTKSKKLYVKYMVSLRCKKIVKSELKKLEIYYTISNHGAIEFPLHISKEKEEALAANLLENGLVLLDEQNSMIIDKIITTVCDVVQNSDEIPNLRFNDIINDYIGSMNGSILKIFSDVKGISLIQFIVAQKVNRVKEMLLNEDLPLSMIAEKLQYQSVDLMIAQFKKQTGLPPAYFINLKNTRGFKVSDSSEAFIEEYLV